MSKQLNDEQKEYEFNKWRQKISENVESIKSYISWAFWIWIVLEVINFFAGGTFNMIFDL